MQAVILAGGKGTRLAERLHGRPKPLVDVDGIPLLERQVSTLRGFGVDDVVVLVNHAADQIEAYCAARDDFGLDRLRLIDDGEPRGTAGAVLACLDDLADRFLVVYGDTLLNIDVGCFLEAHGRAGADATLFLHPNDHPFDSDLVAIGPDAFVTAFYPKPHPPDGYRPNLVNAAFYVLERSALAPWRETPVPCDFGKDLFPAMLAAGQKLLGYNSFEYIKDIGTPARLDKAVRHLRTGVVARATLSEPQACVFLDRDGTLNELRDYVRTPDDLALLPAAASAVRRLNDAEYRIAIVTNQPVVARGECTVETLRDVHAKLDMMLAEAGGFADRLYFCPHHPDGGFPGEIASLKFRCECRKPEIGMIRDATRDLHADLDRSWLVGDSTTDLMAARTAGVRSVLVLTGEGGRDGRYPASPDYVAADVGEATTFILDVYPRLTEQVADLVGSVAPGTLVLVGGAARSGKSTIAGVISDGLRRRGLPTNLLRLDRWIRPAAERGPGVRGRYDIRAVEQALGPWLAGQPSEVAMPFYDRVTRSRTAGGQARLSSDEVLILEGVPALLLELPTERPVLRIHLASEESGRRERTLSDLIGRGSADLREADVIYATRMADETAVVQEAGRAALRFDLDHSFSAIAKAGRA